jgi:lipoyl(octanoyl) transferase
MRLSESKQKYFNMKQDKWRFMGGDLADGAYNMAEDMACLQSCEQGFSPPTIKLYGWKKPTLTIGYSQQPGKLINLEKARKFGIPIIRRPTGGRVILHCEELTYSLIAPNNHPLLGEDLKSSMCVISEMLTNCLVKLGCSRDDIQFALPSKSGNQSGPACFSLANHYELTCRGKKIMGSAQRRMKRAFLQHGSLILKFDRPFLNSLLFFKSPQLAQDNLIKLTESSISIDEYFGETISFKQAVKVFKEGFAYFLRSRLTPGTLTDRETEYRGQWLEKCEL